MKNNEKIQSKCFQEISNEILFTSVFNNTNDKCTWETSMIRNYLNGDFLSLVFNEDEQNLIADTKVSADDATIDIDYYGYIPVQAENTVDKFFLLSGKDCIEYNVPIHAYFEVAEMRTRVSWWLRTTVKKEWDDFYDGSRQEEYFAECVDAYDKFDNLVVNPVDDANIGVRPAMWITVD